MYERGGSEVLRYETVDKPHPLAEEVLVRVHATTVNHTDIFHRTGRFFIQKPLPHILGKDLAGEILAIGSEVSGWHLGDRVVATFEALGRARDGTYAEFTTMPAHQLHRMPDQLDFITAASAGLAFCTAWSALFYSGGLGQGERVVIHAASSGVGTAAVQIARWQNAQVIAISQLNKLERLEQIGAQKVIDRSAPDVVEQVREATNGAGATLVLDLVGRATLQASIDMLAPGGRVVIVGTLSGDHVEIDAMDLIMKNATICGSFQVIRSEDFDTILQLLADGTFQSVVGCVLPLQKAQLAHELVEAQKTFGKVVLVPTWYEDLDSHGSAIAGLKSG
jgi:NADPH:quinone reductase-like Zn-dependent oxidoreductase